jgi:hypothetical protein
MAVFRVEIDHGGFSFLDHSLTALSHSVPALLGRWSTHATPMQFIPDLTVARKRLIFPEFGDYL